MAAFIWVGSGLIFPRITLVALWFLTDHLQNNFSGVFFPLVGIFLAPYTTLAYLTAIIHSGAVSGWWMILVSWAILVDVYHFEKTSLEVKSFSEKFDVG